MLISLFNIIPFHHTNSHINNDERYNNFVTYSALRL